MKTAEIRFTLGLDISSRCVGWAVVNDETPAEPSCLGHIDLSDIKDRWKKIDAVNTTLLELKEAFKGNIKCIGIEEPLPGFSFGHSSQRSIQTLISFNSMVQLLVRQLFGFEPKMIGATEARKVIGVPLVHRKRAGKDQKHQTFDWLMETEEFIDAQYETKRDGSPKDYVFDEIDAFVVASATAMRNGQ